MLRPIFFWDAPDSDAMIYSIGNPLVWWGGALMLLAVLVNLAISPVTYPRVEPRPPRQRPLFWLPLVGYFASYLPLADVKRVLFMYHYFTPLIFSLILLIIGNPSKSPVVFSRYLIVFSPVLIYLLISGIQLFTGLLKNQKLTIAVVSLILILIILNSFSGITYQIQKAHTGHSQTPPNCGGGYATWRPSFPAREADFTCGGNLDITRAVNISPRRSIRKSHSPGLAKENLPNPK